MSIAGQFTLTFFVYRHKQNSVPRAIDFFTKNTNTNLQSTYIQILGYNCTPSLTTIDQNRIYIGKAAFHTKIQLKIGIQISSVQLNKNIVERESVADINDRT